MYRTPTLDSKSIGETQDLAHPMIVLSLCSGPFASSSLVSTLRLHRAIEPIHFHHQLLKSIPDLARIMDPYPKESHMPLVVFPCRPVYISTPRHRSRADLRSKLIHHIVTDGRANRSRYTLPITPQIETPAQTAFRGLIGPKFIALRIEALFLQSHRTESDITTNNTTSRTTATTTTTTAYFPRLALVSPLYPPPLPRPPPTTNHG
jgi:hypothetical protein